MQRFETAIPPSTRSHGRGCSSVVTSENFAESADTETEVPARRSSESFVFRFHLPTSPFIHFPFLFSLASIPSNSGGLRDTPVILSSEVLSLSCNCRGSVGVQSLVN